MLERLNEVNWDELEHAYGAASDVPDCLRKLASNDPKIREAGLYDLYGNLWHQGTVYEATAFAVPFLIELLESDDVQEKEKILVYLGDLAYGNSYHDVHQHLVFFENERSKPEFQAEVRRELEWVRAAHEAVAARTETYHRLLDHHDPVVRSAAAYLLGVFPLQRDRTLPILFAHNEANESSEVVHAAIAFSVGLLANDHVGAIDWLTARCADSRIGVATRTLAACGLARTKPMAMPREGKELLLRIAANPGSLTPIFEQFPWHDADPQTYCSAALEALGCPPSEVIPAMIQALEMVTPYQSWNIVTSILSLVFDAKPMPDGMSASQLSADQRMALTAISNSKKFWTGFAPNEVVANVVNIMESFGLPRSASGLKAFLDGKLHHSDKGWSDPFGSQRKKPWWKFW